MVFLAGVDMCTTPTIFMPLREIVNRQDYENVCIPTKLNSNPYHGLSGQQWPFKFLISIIR
jgi:hypothetical protein